MITHFTLFSLLLIFTACDAAVREGKGLTFDPCTADADCTATRRCLLLRDDTIKLCLTGSPVFCSKDVDCDPGENCADVPSFGVLCASSQVVEEAGFSRMDKNPQAEESQPPATGPRSPLHGDGTGLVLEDCQADSDCLAPRICLDISPVRDIPCTVNATDCVCGYQKIPNCKDDGECAPGEICLARDPDSNYCISKAVIGDGEAGDVSDATDDPLDATDEPLEASEEPAEATDEPHGAPRKPRGAPRKPPVAGGTGSTKKPRTTTSSGTDSTSGTGTSATTVSSEPSTETSSEISADASKAPSTETSNETTNPGLAGGSTTTPTTEPELSDLMETPAAPEPSSEQVDEDGVCVDAELLNHLERHELVFAEDRLARVLCDTDGSCATKGHMVRWLGRAMMMRNYCAEVECVEKVVKVNSPRYKTALSIKSKSEGLVFTAFAARFGTRVEEQVLRGVIRVGL